MMNSSRSSDGCDDHGGGSGPLINISICHGPSQSHHQIHVPAQSTFRHMKEVIEQKTGLEPKQQKIFFRGKEKEDEEYLHEAGVKDNSKLLVLENPVSKEERFENTENEGTSTAEPKEREKVSESEMKERKEMSKSFQAIAEVREEVDNLAERVSVLEVAVNGGTKVAEEEFTALSELLMRQLLKLDTVEAEGESKMQRKAEVRRVQKYQEVLDNLKASDSEPSRNNSNAVSVTTEWETFDASAGSLSPPPVSSSTRITQDWERFD